MKGQLFVICGPSGAGKTSIIKEVLKRIDNVVFSVSCTTRPKRPHEVDGEDYFFITEEEFLRRVEKGEFLEWARVHGHLYGTPRSFVETHIAEGKDVILDIDVQGALSVKKNYPNAVFVYIAPPSYSDLKERILARGTEREADILVRLENAKWELMFMDEFDYIVINDDLQRAIETVLAILTAERSKVSRNLDRIEQFKMEVKGWKRW
ncbi:MULTISPECIES: guanylate kinase [Thermotoga]|uniref:Guanylate kinase n=1 Tax=Thermotoga neapolitana (strain ATCC 49049 / DSM 4359 / NBRC 107923 / NS-E) TaxID=309803 RepID=B9K7W9_THENN|nr:MULTISPECIES: guanylate kinase [Thermotoga]ACM23052.1 Guanylate kinase [Thermotoga neapolitana DSM 4359]AJG40968.1 guanylate kinase [Thermotoga sp. RQ7]KFZ21864.1 guanylate kinase [Thermotoga neapolitana LA10]HBF11666.1 guanylate kinase [Thermotoga neapolitana]